MNGVFALVLSMSAGASVLIVLCLLSERIGNRRTPRWWQYYIWILVLARLLIPFGPDTELFSNAYGAIANGHTEQTQATTPSGSAADTMQAPEMTVLPNVSAKTGVDLPQEQSYADASAGPGIFDWVWVVWCIGAVVLLVRRITVFESYNRYVKAGMSPVNSVKLLDLLSEASAECGVKRPIELAVNPLVSSPLVMGLAHPCIVLPDENISGDEFRYVVIHELTHLRRFDIVYKWVMQAAVCLHWFNPLVHVMVRRTNRVCEFSCDEAVVRCVGRSNIGGYADTLVNAMAAGGVYAEHVAPTSLSQNARMLKERLVAMRAYGTKIKGSAIAAILLTVCLVLCTACSGVYRTGTWGFIRSYPHANLYSSPHAVADGSDMSIDISDCSVTILESTDAAIHADYDPAYYEVSIDNSADAAQISCRATRDHAGKRTITLYVPLSSGSQVNLAADGSFIEWLSISHGNIDADMSACYIRMNLSPEYDGAMSVSCADSYMLLDSDSDFAGISMDLSGTYIAAPESFIRDGGTIYRNDGDAANVSVSMTDGLLVVSDGSTNRWGRIAADAADALPDLPALPDISGDAEAEATMTPADNAPSGTHHPTLSDSIRSGLRELIGAIFGFGSGAEEITWSLPQDVSDEIRSAFHEAAEEVRGELRGS